MSEPQTVGGEGMTHVKRVMLVLWENYLSAQIVPLVNNANNANFEVTKIFVPRWVAKVWREAHGERATMLGRELLISDDDTFYVASTSRKTRTAE